MLHTFGTTQRETHMSGFVLTSPSFDEGGAIPIRHTCDGTDVSPALNWEGAPRGTVALALVVDDPDARNFTHWVVYDIPGGSAGSMREGLHDNDMPPQGRNDFGRTGWGGPCPPSGTHHYRFTLWALSSRIGLSGTPSAGDVLNAVAMRTLGRTTLVGTYTRQK
jgi:Raf kinase inhibitor-like YbhB/YbcL family protein